VAPYSSAGMFIVVAQVGGLDDEAALAVAAYPGGDIVVGGEFRGITTLGLATGAIPLVSAGETDFFVARFDAQLSASNLETWMRQMTSAPFYVGAPHNKANADMVAEQLRSWGYEVEVAEYQVLFPTPRVRVVEMVAPEPYRASLEEPAVDGLNDVGRAIVREMQRIGVLVDLSHVATVTMHAALNVATAPVIFSHSSARAVTDHRRNVPDDVLARLRENGGVVQLTFVPYFVSAEVHAWSRAAAAEYARHAISRRRGEPEEDALNLLRGEALIQAGEPEAGATLLRSVVATNTDPAIEARALELLAAAGLGTSPSEAAAEREEASPSR